MLVEGLEPGVPHRAVPARDHVIRRDGRVLQRGLQLLCAWHAYMHVDSSATYDGSSSRDRMHA